MPTGTSTNTNFTPSSTMPKMLLHYQNGKITCRYNDNCTDADNSGPLRVVQDYDANDELQFIVASYKPSQTTTPQMGARQHQQHHLYHLDQTGAEGSATQASTSASGTRIGRSSKSISSSVEETSPIGTVGTNIRQAPGSSASPAGAAEFEGTISGATLEETNSRLQQNATSTMSATLVGADEAMVTPTKSTTTTAVNSGTTDRADSIFPSSLPALQGSASLSSAKKPLAKQQQQLTPIAISAEPEAPKHSEHGRTDNLQEDSSFATQRSSTTIAAMSGTPTGVTKTRFKRSLLQMLPSSTVDYDSVARIKRREKRSERG
ncbi:hypothetical protein ZHAS_00005572 [Anopheles sinensis]|uniref:Uncharacterized protein n=1 Tax=Anopheles sinensis TaxID=74873 RepID=A0A084VJV9_ANOSI|nr:hypothetical protein ZHAS_00005572 [Anopheles sinensis]